MKFRILITLSLFLYSCDSIGAGSFGAWKMSVFPLTNKELTLSINSLYKTSPQYRMPEKWKYELKHWANNGYESSKMFLFYFKNPHEEVYFASLAATGLVDHPEYARIAVISIYNEKTGWKEIKKQSDKEKIRIQKQFEDEILSKLEKSTNTVSFYEKTYP